MIRIIDVHDGVTNSPNPRPDRATLMSFLKRTLATAAMTMACIIANGASAADPAIEIVRSRTYVTRDSGSLDADVYMPPGNGPFPGMLVVHGGAWRVGTRA